jgi:hypothetical protein
MRKTKLAALLTLCLASPLVAQQTPPAAAPDAKFNRRQYAIQRLAKPITVDGVIDAAEWVDAKPIDVNWETFPGNNLEAKVRTEALLGYDDRNLYIALRAFDPNPSAIRAHLTDRDNAYSDDFIGVAIDTFNDERRAFEFFANPLGVQMDLTNNDVSGNEDDSWDAIWNSAGRIHADRYEVEMAIPFSQIRFRDSAEAEQTWGLDIVRVYPRDQRYRIGLHPQNKEKACYVCQMSKLTGFRGISPGRNLEIAPTLTTQRTDSRRTVTSPLATGAFDTEPGVTTRWGVTPNLTLNGAINPDFSQVEADSPQLDVNNTFALFFNEKRPFFLEAADFFETPLNIVYTRTVAEPDWGLKLTGKEGVHGGGVFLARDARTQLVIPGSQRSDFLMIEETNTAGVLRYRHDVGKNANIGAMFTNRSGNDYANRVGGVDGNFRVTQRDTIQAQYLFSQTNYPDTVVRRFRQKESLSDDAMYLRYRHNSREWYWSASYTDIGTDFRADSGYMPRVGYSTADAALERIWWPKDDRKTWYTRIFWGGDWDKTEESATGATLEEEYESWIGFGGPMQSYVSLDVGTRRRSYNRRQFDREKFVNLSTEITPHKRVYLSLDFSTGDHIDFTNTEPAKRMYVNPYIRIRANRNLELGLSHQYEQLEREEGRLYDAHLSELRAVYQFNIRTFVRALLQYSNVTRNPALYRVPPNRESKSLFPQLLFSYKINPQTVLFVGYSSNRIGTESIDYTEVDRTLFVKVGYAWAI